PPESRSFAQRVLDVFLPVGFPHSVTEDYMQYQIYDSLQAFSSSIAGMLASRAVLQGKLPSSSSTAYSFSPSLNSPCISQCIPHYAIPSSHPTSPHLTSPHPTQPLLTNPPGVGVGDATASPTAALLLSVLQESMGRLATILFAHKLGTALEPECKKYRLAADVFNDTAMILDCLSPAFPKPLRVLILSFSSVLRSLCGVCAGSAKASLSAHFAKRGNLGELNAKDSSQETVISLLGMLAGSVVVSWVSTPVATWSTLILLLSIHLGTNYAAVKAVSMRCLNRQRANIVFSAILHENAVPRPRDVSQRERIFERDGVLRWADDRILGHCSIGVPMQTVLQHLGLRHKQSGSVELQAVTLSDLVQIFHGEAYVLWYDSEQSDAWIVLKQGCTPIDQLKAWAQALLLAQRAHVRGKHKEQVTTERRHQGDGGRLAELTVTLEETQKLFDTYANRLVEVGWDLDTAALETQAGMRLKVMERI
ncbi:vitamin B6 photo-protection and homoeostasis-domain-containing protein, partial [Massariosphaeria phaeospora]